MTLQSSGKTDWKLQLFRKCENNLELTVLVRSEKKSFGKDSPKDFPFSSPTDLGNTQQALQVPQAPLEVLNKGSRDSIISVPKDKERVLLLPKMHLTEEGK